MSCWSTPFIPARHQGYLEPHAAVVAIDNDGRIQVSVSAKNPFGIRSQLAKALRLPEDRIRINVVNVGGEFGGKGDASDLPVAYFLAQESGRPVKMVMTYAEELTASNPAHPTVITIRSGVKNDGRIVARSLRAVHASGAYGALKSNASLATWHYAGGSIASTTPPSSFSRFTRIRSRAVITAAPAPWRLPSPLTRTRT